MLSSLISINNIYENWLLINFHINLFFEGFDGSEVGIKNRSLNYYSVDGFHSLETLWYFFHRLKSFTSYDSIIFHSTGEQKIQKGMLTLLYFSFLELFANCEKKKIKISFRQPQIMSLTKVFFTIIRGLGIKANKNPSL